MPRAAVLLLLLGAPLAAQDEYEVRLRAALAEGHRLAPGEERDEPLDRAYLALGEVVKLAPRRWEAYAERGLNRCLKVVEGRQIVAEIVDDRQAQGAVAEELATIQQKGLELMGLALQAAHGDFQRMERNMREGGVYDPRWVVFANASMKYAKGEYGKTDTGEPGAIADLQTLIRAGWQVDRSSEFLARCHLQLGAAAYADGDFQRAQSEWDEALRWARSPRTRRLILSNKAGGYAMDNEFGLAEQILRERIAQEPNQAVLWKDLGLVLGYQNKLRAALHAYEQARRLCETPRTGFPLALLHGNAWLKSAMIHGKLLEEDGDLLLAWRLFLEYRALHGDDYNFCFNFGDFAFHMGEYQLAWDFLSRARDLHPFCPAPYQLLLTVALRIPGSTPAEAKARIDRTNEEFRVARERYLPREQSPEMTRICSGLRDGGDVSRPPGYAPPIEPDPLAGLSPADAPEWIRKAALRRRPLRPYDPAIDDPPPAKPGAVAEPGGARPPPAGGMRSVLPIAGGAALLLAATIAAFLLRRRRPA